MFSNLGISISLAAVEAIALGFIAYRSNTSQDPWIRAQKYCFPILCSILFVEIAEALIWMDKNLIRIDDPVDNAPLCSAYNQALTMMLMIFAIPLQPFFAIHALRRVGDKNNFGLLFAVEMMAIFYMMNHWGNYIFKILLEDEDTTPPRQYIQQMEYKTWANSVTCSYIGPNDHLFYTLNIDTDWTSPNGVTLGIFWVALPFAKPWRFCSALCFPMAVSFLFLVYYYDYSVELLSIFWRSGAFMFAYLLIQPHVFPCTGKYKYWDFTMIHNDDDSRNASEEMNHRIKSN